MSRSRKRTPIIPTASGSEKWDKAKWHRRHRASERVLLQAEGEDHTPRSHHENSSLWLMNKDGKHYYRTEELCPKDMRK
jgi:hypothetical protein